MMEYFLFGVAEANAIIEELKLLEECRDNLYNEIERLAEELRSTEWTQSKEFKELTDSLM
mgnify:CR=1 FL=1